MLSASRMLGNRLLFDVRATLLLSLSFAAGYSIFFAAYFRVPYAFAGFALSIISLSAVALFSRFRILTHAAEDEPTALVEGEPLLAARRLDRIPDQVTAPLPSARLTLASEKDEEMEKFRELVERFMDPELQRILIKLAEALEPHIRAGYKVKSIEVRIAPKRRPSEQGKDQISVAPKAK